MRKATLIVNPAARPLGIIHSTATGHSLYTQDIVPTPNALLRLRKHADYQRVYGASRKQFSKQMAFFYSMRPEGRRSDTLGPRIGLTVGKVLGMAVERNRIKRRLRECVRRHAATLTFPVDVILHPRRTALTLEAARLDAEVAQIFRTIQNALLRQDAR